MAKSWKLRMMCCPELVTSWGMKKEDSENLMVEHNLGPYQGFRRKAKRVWYIIATTIGKVEHIIVDI
jgi:hypothetical protein